MSDPEKLDRMLTLVPWVRGLGVCGVCALAFALAQVEKESGDTFVVPPNREGCKARVDCRERAKARWKELPTTKEKRP